MSVEKTIHKGIVLKAMDYGENDKILHIYTPDAGKLPVLMRGVRQPKAKMKFAAQPFCFVEFTLVGRGEMMTCAGASEIESFFEISQSLDKLVAASSLLEMTDVVSNPGEANPSLFIHLLRALQTLATTDTEPTAVSIKFALEIFTLTGYALNLDHCRVCGDKLDRQDITLDLDRGALVCSACGATNGIEVTSGMLTWMKILTDTEFTQLKRYKVNLKIADDLVKLIATNFAHRFNHNLKSLK